MPGSIGNGLPAETKTGIETDVERETRELIGTGVVVLGTEEINGGVDSYLYGECFPEVNVGLRINSEAKR